MNLVHEKKEVSGPSIDCKFIDAEYDSEPEYGILQLESAVSSFSTIPYRYFVCR